MIPRIRTVKPELFKHEALFEAEQLSQLPLRLAFIGLFACCDREGRFPWQPKRLKVDIFPYDPIDFSAILEALGCAGFVRQYAYQGQLYGYIPSWPYHQRINKKEPQSLFPGPYDGQEMVFQPLMPPALSSTAKGLSEPSAGLLPASQQAEIFVDEPSTHVLDALSTTQARAGTCLARTSTWGKEGKGTGKEQEGNKEPEGNGSLTAPKERPLLSTDPIKKIFEHWKKVMHHPQSKLDRKRHQLIRNALKLGYSVETLCEAIRGCSLTPHNQGDNDRGQRYDGLHIILRDAEQIDRFLHNAQNPPRVLSTADRLSRNNAEVLQRWADQNLLQEAVYEAH